MGDPKLYIIQHVPYEGPGKIADWLESEQIAFEVIRLYAGDLFPSVNEVNGLIVMGGPMGVYDDNRIPWMSEEKKLIKESIDNKIPVLGVC